MSMDSEGVFEILVREHAALLDVYLKSAVRDPGRAEDLFQETVVTAWQRLERFDRSRPFGPWLRGIARRLVLAEARRNANAVVVSDEQTLLELEAQCAELHSRPGDTLDEKLDRLRDCLERLDPRHRDAVRARYEEGLRGVELANHLKTNVENAKKTLQRARRKLAWCFGEDPATGGAA